MSRLALRIFLDIDTILATAATSGEKIDPRILKNIELLHDLYLDEDEKKIMQRP